MSMASETTENLFDYDNYRIFLEDYFEEQKRTSKVFSHRFFARRAGISNPSFTSQVIKGKRNLSYLAVERIGKGLKLTKIQSEYFKALVIYNQSKKSEERLDALYRMEQIRQTDSFSRFSENQYRFFSKWDYTILRELVVYSNWNGSYRKLGGYMRPALSAMETREAVQLLVDTELIEQDEQNNWRQTSKAMTTDGVPAFILRQRRKELLLQGIDSCDNLSTKERHTSYVTLSISRKTYEEFSDQINQLRKKMLAMALEDTNEEQVFQVVFQMFPVSENFHRKQ